MRDDIQKFGRENFTREILFDFDNFTDMDNKEKELVTESFVARDDTYNVRLGGQNLNFGELWHLAIEKERQLWNENPEWRLRISKQRSEMVKRLHRTRPELYVNFHSHGTHWIGRHHSEETKKKIGEKNKRMVGELNSNWGMVWIYNESLEQNKKVKKEEVETFLNQGWKLGRRMNFHK